MKFFGKGKRVNRMDEKVSLYTYENGRERYYNGEVFLASTTPNETNKLRFSVSKKYVFGNGHNKDFLVIDTGSDTEF